MGEFKQKRLFNRIFIESRRSSDCSQECREGKLFQQSIQELFVKLILREVNLPHGGAEIQTLYADAQSFQQNEVLKFAFKSSIADSITAIGACTKVLCILKSEIKERSSVTNVFDKMMDGAEQL